MKALKDSEQRAIEMLSLSEFSPRRATLEADPLVQFVLMDAEANVICPPPSCGTPVTAPT